MDSQEDIKHRYALEAKIYRDEALLVNFEAEKFFTKLIDILHILYPDINESLKVLDIGAGNGMLTELIYKNYSNAQITMFDISEEMLNSAREYYALNNFNINVKYVIGDFIKDKLPDEKYDLIISSFALHHTREYEDLANVYEKVANNLDTDGTFLCIDYFLGNTDAETKNQVDVALATWTHNFSSEKQAATWADIIKSEDSPATLHTIYSLLKACNLRVLLSKENGVMTTLYGMSKRELNYFINSELDSLLLVGDTNNKEESDPKTYKIDHYPFK